LRTRHVIGRVDDKQGDKAGGMAGRHQILLLMPTASHFLSVLTV
jgi:hypothetical protein